MISLRLSPELEEKLIEISNIENKTKTDILKESFQMYVRAREMETPAYELAKKHFGHSLPNQSGGSIHHSTIVRNKIKKKHNA